jgi:outer membrane protein assembly factor BamE (lipoprotein component of BamABCDE complex)
MIVIGLCVLLCGCAAAGVEVKPSQVTQLKRGITTEQDVERILGHPTSMTVTADGGQTWVYSYASIQMRPTTFVPIVGLFAGGADTRQTVTILRFGPDGTLIDYSSSAGGVGAASGLAAPATPSAPGPTSQP